MRTSTVVLGLGAVLIAWRCTQRSTSDACPTVAAWVGPAPHYDYFLDLDLRDGGRGTLTLGYAQAVRCDLAFRWRQDGEFLVVDRSRVHMQVERGDFDVPLDAYPEPEPHRFHCRLTLDRDPFDGCGEGLVYYSCPE